MTDGKAEPLFRLLDAWDNLSRDIDRVLTALPGQMSEASGRLDVSRKAMRDEFNAFIRARSTQDKT